jgi:hypothetical protein
MSTFTQRRRQRRIRYLQAAGIAMLAAVFLTPRDLSAVGAVLQPLNPIGTVQAGEAPTP